MSDVNLQFTVNSYDASFTAESIDLSFNPVGTELTIYTGYTTHAPGSSGQVAYNNSGSLTGATGLTYNNTTQTTTVVKFTASDVVTLGSVGNVRISGGSNNQALVTNGSGNLTFANIVGGSSTQIQYNNGGLIAGNSNFTFNQSSSTMVLNGNANIDNIYVGNYYYSNGAPLDLSTTYSNANVAAFLPTYTGDINFVGSNISLGNVSNLHITGGGAGQVLTTDGAGTLTFSSVTPAPWVDPTAIPVGAIFTGIANPTVSIGATYVANSSNNTNRNTFISSTYPYQIASIASNPSSTDLYGASNNKIVKSVDNGHTWTVVHTAAGTLIAIKNNGSTGFVAVGESGVVAYSTNGGTSWTNTTAGTATFNCIEYFNSLFIAVGTGGVIYTSPTGATWTSRTSGTANNLISITKTSTYVVVSTTAALYRSTNGTTWTTGASNGGVLSSNGTTIVLALGNGSNQYRYSTDNGATVTLVSVTTLDGTSCIYDGTIVYDSSISKWVTMSAASTQVLELADITTGVFTLSTDYINFPPAYVFDLGVGFFDYIIKGNVRLIIMGNPGNNGYATDSTVGPLFHNLPTNLIYVDLITLLAAPAGSYRALGSLNTDSLNSQYMWVRLS